MKRLLYVIVLLFAKQLVFAQGGTVINDYAAVLSYPPCARTLSVDTANGFAAGDKLLVMQMKGIDINSTNTASFGNVVNRNNVGHYEINEISAISGSVFTLQCLFCGE